MATVERTREQAIDRFVEMEALDATLRSFVELMDRVDPSRLSSFGDVEALVVSVQGESSMEIAGQLWPEDDDWRNDENALAWSRVRKLQATLCAALAGSFGQEWLIHEAMRHAADAERQRHNPLAPNDGGHDA